MIGPEPEDAHSRRLSSLAKKLRNKRYRDGYLSSHTRMFLANQLVSLQGEMSQKEFGELLGKAQPIISRLQNPDYGKYTLQTLLDIASKLNIALIVRFVDFPTFINFTSDFSDEALRPTQFDSRQLDALAAPPSSIQVQQFFVGKMGTIGGNYQVASLASPTKMVPGLTPAGIGSSRALEEGVPHA